MNINYREIRAAIREMSRSELERFSKLIDECIEDRHGVLNDIEAEIESLPIMSNSVNYNGIKITKYKTN